MVIYGDACGSNGQQFLFYIHDLYFCCHLCSASLSDVIWKPVLKTVWYWVWRFVAYSLVTLASVSVILLPVVAMTLSTGRAGAQHTFSIMYPLSYYRKLLYGFLIGGSTYWSELGYTGIVLLAVLLLLFGGKKTGGCVPDLYL